MNLISSLRSWPVTRRNSVIGAVIGIFVTIAPLAWGWFAPQSNEAHGELFTIPGLLMMLVMYPTWLIGNAFGSRLFLSGPEGLSLPVLFLAVCVNSCLFLLAGIVVGHLRQRIATARHYTARADEK